MRHLQPRKLPVSRPLRWWIHLCGLLAATFSLVSVVALYVVELSRSNERQAEFLRSEGPLRIGAAVALAIIAFLPYWVLGRATPEAKYAQLVMGAAIGCLIVDVGLRMRLIFFPLSSTDGIAALLLPLWLTAAAVAVWIVVTYLRAHMKSR